MTDALESFLGSISEVDPLLAKHQDAVAVFGYFLSAVAGEHHHTHCNREVLRRRSHEGTEEHLGHYGQV